MGSTATVSATCRTLALAGLTALALTGCGTAPRSQPVGSEPAAALPRGSEAVSQARHEVVRSAAEQIGTPYRYGGNSRSGFDCSGLVQYAHHRAGIRVPRTTTAQWRSAQTPQRRHLLPGDLLFFHIGEEKGQHVGIYEGGGVFIHAPSAGKTVSRATLDSPYWRDRLVEVKSFL